MGTAVQEPTAPTIGRIRLLDGYRGIAVAAVLLFHGHVLRGGWLGVDLFFVLSGFLITRLLVDERARTGRTDLVEFWRRRSRRLLPALVLLLVGVAVWAWWYPDPQLLPPDLAAQATAAMAYVANWYQLHAGIGYWDQFGAPSPIGHLWSLSVEEQFYVVFPLVFLGVAALQRTRRAGARALAAGAVVSWGLGFVVLVRGASVDRVYLGTDTRIGAVLIGAACGFVTASGPLGAPVARAVHRLVPVALAGVAAAFLLNDGGSSGAAWRWLLLPVFEVAVCILLVDAVTERPARDRTDRGLHLVVGSALLVWLGTISYGLYLWHFPVFLAVERRFATAPRPVVLGLGILVSLVIAQASYTLVERPIRHRGTAVAPRFVVLGVGVLLALGSVLWLHRSTATARAYRAERTGAVGTSDLDVDPTASAATVPTGAPPSTAPARLTLPLPRPAGRPPRLLLVGDSLAYDMVPQFRPTITRLGLTGGIASSIGCGTGGIERSRDATGGKLGQECLDFVASWPDLVRRSRPDVVVLVRAAYRLAVPPGETPDNVCGAAHLRWYRGALADELRALRSSGAPVVVASIVYDRYPLGDHTDGDRAVTCLNREMRQVVARTPGATMLDLSEWVCPVPTTCRTTVAGTTLRPDGLHFQGPGAEKAITWIAEQVLGRR